GVRSSHRRPRARACPASPVDVGPARAGRAAGALRHRPRPRGHGCGGGVVPAGVRRAPAGDPAPAGGAPGLPGPCLRATRGAARTRPGRAPPRVACGRGQLVVRARQPADRGAQRALSGRAEPAVRSGRRRLRADRRATVPASAPGRSVGARAVPGRRDGL
ncbi:MAG: hypothetical protein AVDCRST_MAG79-2173, partial [uncultured Thermoleophilia bacterium]